MNAEFQQFLPWLFPRFLGLVYFLAFLSLLVQVRGLYGADGILPISVYLRELKGEAGKDAYLACPTLFWFNSSDRALTAAALLGVLLSVALMAGAPPIPLLVLLWLLYLSFVSAGQDFLAFQWDALLLEVGFMTIFLPLAAPAPPLVVFTYRFLLFRFMVSSGAVKLLSRDRTWRDLTAMCHHYQTQPIPNRVAWYAHHLPVNLQKMSTLATLVFELAVPVLAFATQQGRIACFWIMILLQVLIFSTGNFAFFNILTMVMALPLLDDSLLSPFLELPAAAVSAPAAVAVSLVFGIFLILNLGQLVLLLHRPHWLMRIYARLSPFMISGHYGLFAVMTTNRFEFVIEGSNDGATWLPYEFRYKPGDPKRAPRQVAPHQPRLDWQMWFAALDPNYLEPWLRNLVVRLLQGKPAVLTLLEKNPFPQAPPQFIRLTVYRYRFGSPATRRSQGVWWERDMVGRFSPMKLQKQEPRQNLP